MGTEEGEQVNIYSGAYSGMVFIATSAGQVIAVTPEGAEKLAVELPRLAAWARTLRAGNTPQEVIDIDAMAGTLVCKGYKWSRGAWRSPTGTVISSAAYPTATLAAYEHATKEK